MFIVSDVRQRRCNNGMWRQVEFAVVANHTAMNSHTDSQRI